MSGERAWFLLNPFCRMNGLSLLLGLSPPSPFTLTYVQSAEGHKLSLQCKDIIGKTYINLLRYMDLFLHS